MRHHAASLTCRSEHQVRGDRRTPRKPQSPARLPSCRAALAQNEGSCCRRIDGSRTADSRGNQRGWFTRSLNWDGESHVPILSESWRATAPVSAHETGAVAAPASVVNSRTRTQIRDVLYQ